MAENDNLSRVWDIIERVGVCMLTTRFDRGLRARPLEARPDRAAGLIWFVTDLHSAKEHEIEVEHDVGLTFIDASAKAYLSITARAAVRRDHAKAADIWKSTDRLWWDGPASKAVAAFEFVKALIGGKPNLGENRKTTVEM